MKERFGVAVEDGTVEKLRELAGGQRKIGDFLSGVIRFLDAHAELIASNDWQNLRIVSTKEIAAQEARMDKVESELEKQAQLVERLVAQQLYWNAVEPTGVRVPKSRKKNPA